MSRVHDNIFGILSYINKINKIKCKINVNNKNKKVI